MNDLVDSLVRNETLTGKNKYHKYSFELTKYCIWLYDFDSWTNQRCCAKSQKNLKMNGASKKEIGREKIEKKKRDRNVLFFNFNCLSFKVKY